MTQQETASKAKARAADDWVAVVNSPFAGVYITELYWLARDTREACLRTFDAAIAPPPESSYIKVDHELHRELYRILNNAARMKALIKSRVKSRNQSASAYEFQEFRTNWLGRILGGISTSELLHAKVRNTLEHFDEYLDQTAIRSWRGSIPTPTLIPTDMTLGRDGTLEQFDIGGTSPTIYPLRVYLAEERVFVNCGERISLQEVADECQAIQTRLEGLDPNLANPGNDEEMERGSSMLVITADSFSDHPKGTNQEDPC